MTCQYRNYTQKYFKQQISYEKTGQSLFKFGLFLLAKKSFEFVKLSLLCNLLKKGGANIFKIPFCQKRMCLKNS